VLYLVTARCRGQRELFDTADSLAEAEILVELAWASGWRHPVARPARLRHRKAVALPKSYDPPLRRARRRKHETVPPIPARARPGPTVPVPAATSAAA
jgi:hypothetical protein